MSVIVTGYEWKAYIAEPWDLSRYSVQGFSSEVLRYGEFAAGQVARPFPNMFSAHDVECLPDSALVKILGGEVVHQAKDGKEQGWPLVEDVKRWLLDRARLGNDL